MNTLYFRLLTHEDKAAALAEALVAVREGHTLNPVVHAADPASFRQVPGAPFAYWVSERIRRLFTALAPFELQGREIRVGDHPGDGFRYLRLFWEIPTDSQEHDWRPYQKGGDYSPYYFDVHLVTDWDTHRQTYRGFHGRPGRPTERPSNYQYFFRPGLTWPRRTQRGLALRVLPSDCIFADKGPAVFIVDDPDHPDDIVRRVREVLEILWQDRAETIEQEACEILGVKALRDYFRKPGKDGFWDNHVKRYSKSRRKAPIYWLLQSSKKNYALWFYYHRLDKDILFKALLNYVEPKIRLEENRLEPLRAQRAAAGASGKGVKKLEKDIDQQEEFISALRDFEDKLRRVANLHLEPDLNDGVILNIAPLWELVSWKEAKKYWEELLDGKYEWSSIGKHLRERSLVRSP